MGILRGEGFCEQISYDPSVNLEPKTTGKFTLKLRFAFS